ncbi:hypothetical protein F5X99DRAFT_385365 [Biscogniauxia marginata]|nr:hypothetical protein F5X99DRAFT_385365 [Biscogniauxia marginata]
MPSGRMLPAEAKALMFGLYPIALCASVWVGGIKQCLTLMLLGFSYNEFKLADRSWVGQKVVNALGFCCFAREALEVVLSIPPRLIPTEIYRMTAWLGVIAAVFFSTVQTQDIVDQEGDRLRKHNDLTKTSIVHTLILK